MADDPKPNYDKWASDPERWSKASRQGPDQDALTPGSLASLYYGTPNTIRDQPKKGSYTVPKMCAGGKVIKSWSK